MLDYMVNDLKRPLETVWQWFCMSNTASRFERGDCSVVAGMSGVEIAYEVLQEAGEPKPEQAPSYSYDRSPEYWTGWALAYYQWYRGRTFSRIYRAVSMTEIRNMYEVYHEMDLAHFVERLDELWNQHYPETNLKRIRDLAGLSQRELAELSGVSVRQIQLFEQRQRDINQTRVIDVLRLSRVLGCKNEDLLEL